MCLNPVEKLEYCNPSYTPPSKESLYLIEYSASFSMKAGIFRDATTENLICAIKRQRGPDWLSKYGIACRTALEVHKL